MSALGRTTIVARRDHRAAAGKVTCSIAMLDGIDVEAWRSDQLNWRPVSQPDGLADRLFNQSIKYRRF